MKYFMSGVGGGNEDHLRYHEQINTVVEFCGSLEGSTPCLDQSDKL